MTAVYREISYIIHTFPMVVITNFSPVHMHNLFTYRKENFVEFEVLMDVTVASIVF
jgi:hypothetical protein